ncbi:MAG: hypothetical protein OXE58_09800 [Acidobacteria bacterium]|nr:hypothetical protein [Acidobacteriota bacterium]
MRTNIITMALFVCFCVASVALAQQQEDPVSGEYECSIVRAPDTGTLSLTCEKAEEETPQPTGNYDYEITNVRRYVPIIDDSDWLYFTWRARRPASSYRVTVRFQQGSFQTTCTEYWFSPTGGEQSDELSIPSVCGSDAQWSAVTITAADAKSCRGCGTFRRTSLPIDNSFTVTGADPTETGALSREFTARLKALSRLR